jgi:hypothetical protein
MSSDAAHALFGGGVIESLGVDRPGEDLELWAEGLVDEGEECGLQLKLRKYS